MPNSSGRPTLLDIAKQNGCDPAVGLIEEVIRYSPEVQNGFARIIKGLNYRARVRTSLPTVAFRAANSGVSVSASTFENRLYECFVLNPRWECDKAVADACEDGAQIYIANEGIGMMEAAMILLSKQFYYGTGNDTLGFPGLDQVVDPTMCVDAAGTTATTGSSVWAVRWGIRDVSWLWGLNGQLQLSPVTEQRILDGSSLPFTAYVQEILARPGLQVASKWSCGKIFNITADSTKTLTDALIGTLVAKFPPEARPEVLYMSARSREQLRASRTATTPTGTPAPTPTMWEDIPIQVTSGILDTETIVS